MTGGLFLIGGLCLWTAPGLVLGSVVALLLALGGLYAILGAARVHQGVASAWLRLRGHHPDLAERLRRRADSFANDFDCFLDRMPETWAERFYLPDLSAPEDDGTGHGHGLEDPFRRMDREMGLRAKP